jgi:hypothetical protein
VHLVGRWVVSVYETTAERRAEARHAGHTAARPSRMVRFAVRLTHDDIITLDEYPGKSQKNACSNFTHLFTIQLVGSNGNIMVELCF